MIYICSMNMKQEFGKWFLDVAKYVFTAMLLTSMLEELSHTWIIVLTIIILVLSFTAGFFLLRSAKKDEDRKKAMKQEMTKQN